MSDAGGSTSSGDGTETDAGGSAGSTSSGDGTETDAGGSAGSTSSGGSGGTGAGAAGGATPDDPTFEEVVNGIFTYAHGADSNAKGITDNHEIDVELLCGEPHVIFVTRWTDYDSDDTFRKWSRAVDTRTGEYRESAVANQCGGSAFVGRPSQVVFDDVDAVRIVQALQD